MQTITCEEYTSLQAEGAESALLDVRNTDEFAAGHMDGAINIPLHVLPLQYAERLPYRDTHIITCCAHGGRASQAAVFLTREGYTNVAVLEGGYEGYCGRES